MSGKTNHKKVLCIRQTTLGDLHVTRLSAAIMLWKQQTDRERKKETRDWFWVTLACSSSTNHRVELWLCLCMRLFNLSILLLCLFSRSQL